MLFLAMIDHCEPIMYQAGREPAVNIFLLLLTVASCVVGRPGPGS